MKCLYYHIDQDDIISYVDPAWDSFAESNLAKSLSASVVINQNIFDYVSEWECRHVYQNLFKHVRECGKSVDFPFRCDAPDKRRYMIMRINLLSDNGIELVSCLIKEEKRSLVPLLDSRVSRTKNLVKMCSWCKKVEIDDDNWVEPEEAIRILHLFDTPLMPQLTHGMCQACYVMVNKKME